MADHLTTCLRSEEATVIAILKAAPFNHQHVQTFGDFTDGQLNLNTYEPGGAPGQVASVTRVGTKVIVHTRSA